MARNAPYYTGGEFGGFPNGAPMDSKPGMFAAPPRRGPDWGQLGAMILAANNNPLGVSLLRQSAEAQQAEREAEARERQRTQALEDQRNNWLFQQQYQRDNPQRSQTERFVEEILSPDTPDPRRDLLRSIVTPPIPTTVFNPATGNYELQYMPRGGASAETPGPVVDDPTGWTPVQDGGGAGRGGPRTFR